MINSSMSRNYVWTGEGCTNLAQKIDSDRELTGTVFLIVIRFKS